MNDNDNVKKLNNKDVAIEEIIGFFISQTINNMPKHGPLLLQLENYS